MIKAKIVAHSLSPQGNELISVLCTFPRIILAEMNTHRMLSKNTSSSRAIPVKKMVESIEDNPFIPIAFQKTHSGMQGTEYLTGLDYDQAEFEWLEAKDRAIEQAEQLDKIGTTKQLCNRLLEPFMWTTMLITGSKEGWENFFKLRCPQYGGIDGRNNEVYFKSKKETIKHLQGLGVNTVNLKEDDILGWLKINKGQAEIHMMALAEEIYDAMNESTPKQLQAGEWHIPFGDKIDLIDWLDTVNDDGHLDDDLDEQDRLFEIDKVKISTAMAAHTSYTTVGNEPVKSYEKWIDLHDKLINEEPPHSSPLEHASQAMFDDEYYLFSKGKDGQKEHEHGWCGPYKGFKSYRYLLEVENLKL